jgi:hypothetical protein
VLIRDPEEGFGPQALLCTDLDAQPGRTFSWLVKRWQMEATFQEIRQRLGFETQRHWSEGAIRTGAPALVWALLAGYTLSRPSEKARMSNAVRQAAWYDKPPPTFCDALALVRKELWAQEPTFCESLRETDTVRVSRGVRGAANRRGLLSSTMAKVQQKLLP